MKLITKAIDAALRANFEATHDADGISLDPTPEMKPVLKLFTPWAGCTWLISERERDDPDILFGLCDLGMGCPELGSVCLSELESFEGPFGLKIERDMHFEATMTLSEYAQKAREAGAIAA